MKKTAFNEDIKKLEGAELRKKLEELRRELFTIKLNATTAHLKDYSRFNKLKKNVARAMTFLRQKEA